MFAVRISAASILIIIMEAQYHNIDDFCDIVPNERVFHFCHGQAVGMCQHCIICVLVSKLCAKDPFLGLLTGVGWRGEALGLPTQMSSEKLEICICYRVGFK